MNHDRNITPGFRFFIQILNRFGWQVAGIA